MNHHTPAAVLAALAICAGLGLAGCAGSSEAAVAASDEKVATVEYADGESAPATVTLTEEAAQRLGITTDVIRQTTVQGLSRATIPFSAVVYDPDGASWAFTAKGPLSFVRVPVIVESVQGELAVLTDGPSAGTEVVTVGVAELFGTETGVGGE